jgi:hypothetical protein
MMESSIKLADPGFARGISAAADISDNIATGPVWSWLEEPQSDAMMTGMNEE